MDYTSTPCRARKYGPGKLLRGLLKGALVSSLFLGAAPAAHSQHMWAFGNAWVDNLTGVATNSVPVSCNSIGVLPAPGGLDLLFQPGAANPIVNEFFSPVPHDAGAEASLPFPIGGKCKQFFSVRYLSGGPGQPLVLALQQWDYADIATNGILAVGQPVVLAQGAGGHVVGPLQADGSRYIYARYAFPTPVGSISLVSWKINADGTVGSMTNRGTLITNSAQTFEDRVPMELSADSKYLYYLYQVATGTGQYAIARFDLSTNTSSTVATTNGYGITGMEWLPGSAISPTAGARLYVSYRHLNTNGIGGLMYYDLGSIPAGGYSGLGTNALSSSVTNQVRFGFTEIERSPNNLLYLAENTNPIVVPSFAPANPGRLWVLDPVTTTLSPVNIAGSPVQVCRIRSAYSYIIQDQINGENYGAPYDGSSPAIDFRINDESRIAHAACSTAQNIPCPADDLMLTFTAAVQPNQEYKISWEETNYCGSSIPGSTLNYTDANWQRGNGPINLALYGNQALNSTAAQGKYFIVAVTVRSACGATAAYSAFIYIQPPTLANWSITTSGSGSYTLAGETCAAAVAGCGWSPSVVFSSSDLKNTDKYWLEVYDLGTACPGTSVLIANGVNNKSTPTAPPSLNSINLPSYIQSYSTNPTLYGFAYLFNNPGHIFRVVVHVENNCQGHNQKEGFFINNIGGCRDAGPTGASIQELLDNAVSFAPNPVASAVTISVNPAAAGMLSDIVLYNIEGKAVKTLLPAGQQQTQVKADLSTLPAGLYLYKYSVNGMPASGKLSIAH